MLTAVVLVLLAYAGWSVWTVYSGLSGLKTSALTLRQQVLDRDSAGARQSLSDFQSSAARAQRGAGSLPWWVAEHTPGISADARALSAVARAAGQLGDGALPGLVDAASGDLFRQLSPQGGRVDPAAVAKLGPVVRRAAASFARADQELAPVDEERLSDLTRSSFSTFADQVDRVDRALASTEVAVRLLPTMLGADGPRRYLLAFNNNAEVRATGGLPGAAALVEARRGRITLGQQVAGADIPGLQTPVIPQPAVERELYGLQPATYFLDTNFVPDYPRTAELMRAFWIKRYGGDLDGTLSIDAVTLSYLLRATGPVDVDGVQLTEGTVVDELLNNVYLRIKDPVAQNAFFADVVKAVFDRFTAGANPAALLEGIAQGVQEGRVLLHSFSAPEQAVLDPTQIAGRLAATGPGHSRLGIYLQDATGSKMSYYLRRQVEVTPSACRPGGPQTYRVRMLLRSNAPSDAATLPAYITGDGSYGTPPGKQLVFVKVYAPRDGRLGAFSFDGRATKVPTVADGERSVAAPVVLLAPGQSTTLTWTVTTGKDQPSDLEWTMTPDLTAEPSVRTAPSACS